MSRYIDADALIMTIRELPNTPNGFSDVYDKAYIIGVIEELPTADVVDRNECSKCVLYPFKQLRERLETNMVEVVRCKDCRYGHQYTNDKVYCSLGNDMYAYRPKDYCSYGERRGDEQ